MADESLSESSFETPIEDPVLACVVSLRDRLPICDVKKLILDNFAAGAVKSAKKLLWASRQVLLRQKKKKLIDRRPAQRAVEDAEFEDLVDFVNCLDECEQLPSVSVSAKDLVLLPAAVVKQVPRCERSAEDIVGVLSTHCERIGGIQGKIDCLERELKSSLCTLQEGVNKVSAHLSSGLLYQSSGNPRQSNSVSVPRQVDKTGFSGDIDRSLNVVVFGVPESRDLVGTEALVSRAFELAVGRKVTIADCKRIGRFSSDLIRSRPLLVRLASVWDRRLLLSCKYKLKGFSEAKLFVREDRPPNARKTFTKQPVSQQVFHNDMATAKSPAQGGDSSSGYPSTSAGSSSVDNGEHD